MSRALSRLDLSALGALMLGAALHALYFDHIADDAYISFRYSANWAAGNGLVFNPGEYVMGYSNFLWVVLIGVAEWLGIPAPTAAPVLGIALGWALLVLVYLQLHVAFGSAAALSGGLLLATSGTFALWLGGGLEGPLFGLLLTASVVLALRLDASRADHRRFGVLGLLLGLAAITRPEGVFYGLGLGFVLWLRRPDRARATRVALALAVCLAIFGAFTGWAAVYYGDPLPNPYYTKYHPLSWDVLVRGGQISWWFVAAYGGMPLVVVVAWAALCGRRWDSAGWLPLAISGAFVAFFIRVGGDGQAYYRMWFWVLPMLALLLGETVAGLAGSPQRALRLWAAGLVAMVAFANLQHSVTGDELARVRYDEVLTQDVVQIAGELAEQYPGARVAANNVGVLTYVSRLEVIDMLGLTDRHIARAPGKAVDFPAHESHDGAYVLDRRPDIIFYGQPRAFATPRRRSEVLAVGYPSDLDLRRDVRFLRDYAFEHMQLRDGRFVPLFRRAAPAAGS
jgi:hypothetical protein